MSVPIHADVLQAVVSVLVLHQRTGPGGGCICGSVGLGESYSSHIAEVLGSAGLLLRWPPLRKDVA